MDQELNDQMIQRREKVNRLRELGVEPYPYSYDPTHRIPEVLSQEAALAAAGAVVRVAGRIVSIRSKGKTSFAHIKADAARLQIYARLDVLGDNGYAAFKLLDIGDIIGISGTLFRTHTGELTVNAAGLTVLAKAIRPLPVPKEKEVDGQKVVFDEFKDTELRYRQRYVDLSLNDTVRQTFLTRTRIVRSIRKYLDGQGYLEVETPTLQSIYGGANARPFKTHHNALDIDLFLRISNELYLKRLLVGGFDKVYEIVKDFRNEGIDRTHNPEFSMIEFYEAYADYNRVMEHFEQIYYQTAMEVLGSPKVCYNEREIDLTPPWKRVTLVEAVSQKLGRDARTLAPEDFRRILEEKEEDIPLHLTWGTGINAVFSALCEADLIQPTFVLDHPLETTPLCKPKRGDPALVERFEPFINGWEVGNAYSELTDPQLQFELLKQQVERGRGGEEETHPMDHDYIRAMEYGMPPAGGVGIGIDRMVMLFTNSYSIRDVVLFPLMKPEE